MGMTYRIASFNMYKFSFQSDQEIKKNIPALAAIIQKEKFHILAMQEVLTPNALISLKKALGPSWHFRWESPRIGPGYSPSKQAAEGYAFLWDTRVMDLSTTQDIRRIDGKSFIVTRLAEPHIFNQYTVNDYRDKKQLLRNPYYGRFKPVHGFCELRLINIHFRYGKRKEDILGQATLRKREFDILTREIYRKISDKRYGNNMPAYTILLGDYNLNLKRDWTRPPYVEEVVEIDDSNGILRKLLTVQDQLTTLKRKQENENNLALDDDATPSEGQPALQKMLVPSQVAQKSRTDDMSLRGYANNYDHMSYDQQRFNGISKQVRRVDTVRKYYHDDFDLHRKEISDHIPIFMNLNLAQYEEDI